MSAEFQTLVDALRHHARERPDATAATFLRDGEEESASWSYRDLDRRASEIAAALRERKLAGRRALLLHPSGLEFIAALYGCFYAGVVAVPTYPPRVRVDGRVTARLLELMKDAEPSVALTMQSRVAGASWWSARVTGSDRMEWLATDGPDFRVRTESPPDDLPRDAVAMLQYTSGSTRSPKGVILTHANLMDNERAIATQMRHSAASHSLTWLPPYHDMGLIGGILQPLTVGFPLTLMDALHVLQRPVRWLQAMSRTRATTSGAPNSMYELCARTARDEDLEGLDLRSWTVAYNGSEPVRAATLQRFAERFAPVGFRAEALFPCYGLAEATLLVSGRAGPSCAGDAEQVSCGPPAPGFELAIVDAASSRECEPGVTGEIWLSGPSVARGYWQRPDETRQTFENPLPGRSGRFLRTGDLGFVRDGELFVAGRIKDLVIVRGRNLYPQDIEACAGISHPALSPDACVAFAVEAPEGERLIVACELRREARNRVDRDEVVRAVRQAIAAEFDVGVAAILLLRPASIPRTTSGKVRRGACKQAFLDGSWQVDDGPTAQSSEKAEKAAPSLQGEVRRRISEVAGIPERWLDVEEPLANLGVDSLMRLELLLRLEAELDVRLEPSVMTGETTAAALVAAVGAAVARGPRGGPVHPGPSAVGRQVPLTPGQSEFLAASEDPDRHAIVLLCRTPPNVDGPALEQALASCAQRHDAFRMRFTFADGRWTQAYGGDDATIAFRRLDWSDVPRDRVQPSAQALFAEVAGKLDIRRGPLAQAVLVERGPEEGGMLLLCVHHLIADGASIPLLLFDLERAYSGRGGLRADVSFAEWADHLDALAQSERMQHDVPYWRAVCRPLSFDAGIPRGPATVDPLVRLDPVRSRRFLDRFPASEDQHDFFLAAFARGWTEATGQHELLVRLGSHGRFPIDGAAPIRTIGRCAAHFPARVRAEATEADGAIDRIRSQLADIPDHGAGFGLLRYLCRDRETTRAMRELAMPQAAMVYRGRMADTFRRDRTFPVIAHYVYDQAGRGAASQPALMLSAGIDGQLVWWQLSYRPENFAPDLVARIAAAIQTSAAAI